MIDGANDGVEGRSQHRYIVGRHWLIDWVLVGVRATLKSPAQARNLIPYNSLSRHTPNVKLGNHLSKGSLRHSRVIEG